MCTVGPMARTAADLGLALDVLAGPDTARAAAWRLQLPPPRAQTWQDYRVAAWLDDEYCPVDAEVLRVLGDVVDAVRATGARVDQSARPATLREAERLTQQLIQGTFSGFSPPEEFDRLRHLADTADPADDAPPIRHARNLAVEPQATITAQCARFFTDHDVILCPITPTTAIPHDQSTPAASPSTVGSVRTATRSPGPRWPACAHCPPWWFPPDSPATGCPSACR